MIETFNFSDSVFPEHEYPEIGQGFKAGNLVQSIVVQIKKNQPKVNCLRQHHEIIKYRNGNSESSVIYQYIGQSVLFVQPNLISMIVCI